MTDTTTPPPSGDTGGPGDGSPGEPKPHHPVLRTGPVFWAGLGVGLVLTLAGILSVSMALMSATPSWLVLCSGLGILFGAFGSTATIRYKGVVITGVSAIAIALLYVVDRFSSDDFVIIEVSGDVQGASINLYGDRAGPYYVADDGTRHEILVVGKQIRRSMLTLVVYFEGSSDAPEAEFAFTCIPKTVVEPRLGSGDIIQWRFSRADGVLRTSGGEAVNDQEACISTTVGPQIALAEPSAEPKGMLVGSALAQESRDLPSLLQSLDSPSMTLRLGAREALAGQGTGALAPLLDQLDSPDVSYRSRVGIFGALSGMIRDESADREEIARQLTEEDLERVVAGVVDEDRTIRQHAAEFTYALGDPRIIPIVADRFGGAGDNGRYNLILMLEGALANADEAQQAEAVAWLRQVAPQAGPKTRELIERILAAQ